MLDNAVIFEKAFARLNKENRQRVMFLHLNLIGAMLGVLFIF
jgi:predicted tellurium resistance membrane protein TerC